MRLPPIPTSLAGLSVVIAAMLLSAATTPAGAASASAGPAAATPAPSSPGARGRARRRRLEALRGLTASPRKALTSVTEVARIKADAFG